MPKNSSEYAANALPSSPVSEDSGGKLAEWIVNTPYESIPADVVELARQATFLRYPRCHRRGFCMRGESADCRTQPG